MSIWMSIGLYVGVFFYRLLGRTWRLRLDDRAGVARRGQRPGRVIWIIWHNRLLAVPIFWRRWFRHRPGAVLVSRSKDGEILSRVIRLMGGTPVRGSSSRGGAAALTELLRALGRGMDPYITPDGPRGPRYSVQLGAIWLAQATCTPLMPVGIEVSSYWRLKSWDGLIIPKPFARVVVTLYPPYEVPPTEGEQALHAEREKLREVMMGVTETV